MLVTDNGEEIEGEDADVDGRKVHVSFSRDIEDYDTDNIVLAAVNPDADGAGHSAATAAAATAPTTTTTR